MKNYDNIDNRCFDVELNNLRRYLPLKTQKSMDIRGNQRVITIMMQAEHLFVFVIMMFVFYDEYPWHSTPEYSTLKEEITNNEIHSLDISSFNHSNEKAIKLNNNSSHMNQLKQHIIKVKVNRDMESIQDHHYQLIIF